jgi:predicted RNA-binding Zn-ribbon protein involved in translation (DUF1610 family)
MFPDKQRLAPAGEAFPQKAALNARGQRELHNQRPRRNMWPVEEKDAKGVRKMCPNCGRIKVISRVKASDELPRKNYCLDCGQEWWEFEKELVLSADPCGV